MLEGRVWGVLTVRTARELPDVTPERREIFAELIATAISNAETRAESRRVADAQGALRRVATLVAHARRDPHDRP